MNAERDFYVRHLFADADWRKSSADLGFHPAPGGVSAAMEWLQRQTGQRAEDVPS